MINRREFIKLGGAAAGTMVLKPFNSYANTSHKADEYLAVHPFIENNPDAVFIMKTSVDNKKNAAGIKQAALDFGSNVFTTTTDPNLGVPFNHNVVIKPNLTSRGEWQEGYTVEGTMGVITDANFVEGIIERIKNLGVSAGNFYIREVNGAENLTDGGYAAMGSRTGADVQVISTRVDKQNADKIVWKDVPDGVWFNKIPYLWPVNSPNSWLLNISKLKTHGMGVTLCAKNLQGTIAANYQQHCTSFYSSMSIDSAHIQNKAKINIQNNYDRHVYDGIPRWDRPGSDGGIWMETWATRNIDNNITLKPALNIVEGVYSRDGNFVLGPHDGLAQDYMTNVIIFGKNSYYVDVIGHWIAGHEPGNFGLFHLAKERGLITTFNPANIPIYEWSSDGTVKMIQLNDLQRTPLVTYYLQRDYDGQTEEYWHICNEPFEYSDTGISQNKPGRPDTFLLKNNYPNPFNASTSIEFELHKSGRARLEIYNIHGERVQVLVDGYMQKGSHLVRWEMNNLSSGTYFYTLMFDSQKITKQMTLLK